MPSYGEFSAFKTEVMTDLLKRFKRPNLIGVKILKKKPVAQKTAKWDIVEGSRNMGRYVSNGAEAPIRELTPRTRKSADIPLVKEKKVIDEDTKLFISKPGTQNQKYGEQAVADELEQLNRVIDNRHEQSIWQALTEGHLNIDQTDPPVKFFIDFEMSATHQIEKTGTARWSQTTTAKPFSDILTWKKLIARDTWENATDAYMNSTTMNNMLANTLEVQELLKYTYGNEFLKNGILARIAGVDITVYDISYKDKDNTVKYFIPDNRVIVLAKPNLGKAFIGPSEIPKKGGGTSVVTGKFAYSWNTKDPVDTWVLAGNRRLDVMQSPDQLVQVKVG